MYSPEYFDGEGYVSDTISVRSATYFLRTPKIVSGATPVLEYLYYGKSDFEDANTSGGDKRDHHVKIEIKGGKNGTFRTIRDARFNGYRTLHDTVNLLESEIKDSTYIKFTTLGTKDANNSSVDAIAIGYFKISYQRDFDFATFSSFNFSFNNSNSDSLTHFAYSGFPVSTQPNLSLYDVTNGVITSAFYASNLVHFTIKNSGGKSNYFITDDNSISTLSLSNSFTYTFPDFAGGYNYLIITHKSLSSSVAQYSAYRSTTKIDTTNILIKPYTVYTDDLYDIFYYGMHHPVAIQHYCAYMYNNANPKPLYVFLIGKGWQVDSMRQNNGSFYGKDLVPTIGLPPSDMMFTSGIDNDFKGFDLTLNPMMALGRLTAQNDNQVLTYLNKIKENESLGNDWWRKNVIHISGGDVGYIQGGIKVEMDGFRDQIKGPFVGANVWSYYNTSTSFVNITAVKIISQKIDEGAGLLTYYGHGSLNRLGVEIGSPTDDYHNVGKYPIMYLNGCNVGNPTLFSSIGEKQLFTPSRGGIIWLSHSATTLTGTLSSQMTRFYNNMNNSHYPSDVGTLWKETIIDADRAKDYDTITRNIYLTWILQGDPAVKMPFNKLNDYAIYDSTISLFPPDAIANSDSVALRIGVYNLGKASKNDSFFVKVSRNFPAGNNVTYPNKKFAPVYSNGYVYFWMKRDKVNQAQGTNDFTITVDPDNLITEVTKTNNVVRKDIYINGNGVRQIYPPEFGIEPTNSPLLVAQSRNLFDSTTGVYFEIDTNLRFQSPALQKSPLLKGNLITWKPTLLTNDTTVYYWRVRLADTSKTWEVSNFTYVQNSPPGWSQSHWQQYKTISSADMTVDTSARKFEFGKFYQSIKLNMHPNFSSNMGIKPQGSLGLLAQVDGRANLVAVEFDQNNLIQYIPSPAALNYKRYKDRKCGLRAYRMFNMNNLITPTPGANCADTNVLGQDSFVAWVKRIKPGNYLGIVSRDALPNFTKYDTSVINAFHLLGSKKIDSLHADTAFDKNTVFLFMGRKGSPGQVIEEKFKKYTNLIYSTGDELEINPFISGKSKTGSITSITIGPSSSWKQAIQMYTPIELPSYDSARLIITGIDTLKDEVVLDTFKGNKNISGISAQTYPYMKISADMQDVVNRTSPQLKLWQILFDGVPEGTLVVDKTFKFSKPILQFGDSIILRLQYKNISKYAMKKVLVVITNTDPSNNTSILQKQYYKALLSGESFFIDYRALSNSFKGKNILQVSVNPNYEQQEVTLENNIINIPFKVTGDDQHPILDVTFDGRHIMDNEIISAKPTIVITDKDENKFLPLKDSSLIKVVLKRPNETRDSIKYSSGELQFFPATSNAKENKARLEYRPKNLEDGTYELIAQGFDVSGNKAGNREYSIHFQIINKTMVSNFYTYPNPFTTKAHFVFTLTGSEVPSYMKVQILNITGRVVKEINREELGNLRIGNNVTDYAWDGTDTYGDKLANGLYLYRVVVKDAEGKTAEHYKTGGDKYFTHDFGKMYLMR
ncbi:MAG: C25 family cysteine peptidase [Bacteroidetes bacterium]|nr:C25 family cysteine peptidase [Bacteroidota bacterium]